MRSVNPKLYDKKYYLTDCSDFNEFKKSKGTFIVKRFNRLLKYIQIDNSKTVLDIGCGRGELSYLMHKLGAISYGIDYSKEAIALAKVTYRQDVAKSTGRLRYLVMNAKKLKFTKNTFDYIFSYEVMEHLYEEEKYLFLKEMNRVLKPDGLILLHTEPNRLFNKFTYPYWCYPVGRILIKLNNILFGSCYPPMLSPNKIRTDSQKVMHVGEESYLHLKDIFKIYGFKVSIKTFNFVWTKPNLGWKDALFNLIVFLHPISSHFPFNILFGQDFLVIAKKL